MSRHPEIVWAQRSDKVYLTVELPDAQNPTVKLEPDGKFFYRATTGAENYVYEAALELFGAVNVEASKVSTGSRHTFCIIDKQDKGWWKRLLKTEGKIPYIKVDWNKWVDEDEENDSKGIMGMEGLSKLEATGGGMDLDDEGMLYLPELEKEA